MTIEPRYDMIDVNLPDDVEIMIDETARRLWVNIEGRCVLRVQRIQCLRLDNKADPTASGQVHPYVDPHPERAKEPKP